MNRNEMLTVLRGNVRIEKVAEIGVLRGMYSIEIMTRIKPSYLALVDTWGVAHGSYGDYPSYTPDKWRTIEESVRRRFTGPGVEIIQSPSLEASNQFPDESLDMVYIDANHSYESVLEDLHAWSKKVRPGGIIAGHDFNLSSVRKAVYELYDKEVVFLTDEKTIYSFYITK